MKENNDTIKVTVCKENIEKVNKFFDELSNKRKEMEEKIKNLPSVKKMINDTHADRKV